MLDRRDFTGLMALGASALAAGSMSAPAAASPSRLTDADLDATASLHRIYRALRFGPAGRPVFWWMRGRRYALIGNQMTPLFGMEVGSAHVARDLDDEGYEVATASSIYYTDLVSGELLTDWLNPITGKTVTFTYTPPRAARARYRYADGPQRAMGGPEAAASRRVVISPTERVNDRIFIREETYIDLNPSGTGSGGQRYVQDMYTYECAAAALRAKPGAFVDATAHFNDYNDWSPRMQMGDAKGSSVARCSGFKVASFAQMPARWRGLAGRLHGTQWADPEKLLAGVAAA